jgi:hypothetical protein
VMGAQLTQNIAQQVQVAQPAQCIPDDAQAEMMYKSQAYSSSGGSAPYVQHGQFTVNTAGSSSSSTFSVSSTGNEYRMNNNNTNGASSSDPYNFTLPSGSRAPEIALPLASAAIAALLSSMQNNAQHQHQQQRPHEHHHHRMQHSVGAEKVACK